MKMMKRLRTRRRRSKLRADTRFVFQRGYVENIHVEEENEIVFERNFLRGSFLSVANYK